jgi:hypothetical protein
MGRRALGDIEHRHGARRAAPGERPFVRADDLSGIGADGADDPVIVSPQFGVAEIFTGLDLPGACRVSLSLRGFERLHRLIIRDLSGVAIFQQFALAVFLSLAPCHLGLRFRNFGLRDLEVLPVLQRVEAREKIVLPS